MVDRAEAVLVVLGAAEEVERGARPRPPRSDRLRDEEAADAERRVRGIPSRLVRAEATLPPEPEEHADDFVALASDHRGRSPLGVARARRSAAAARDAAARASSTRRGSGAGASAARTAPSPSPASTAPAGCHSNVTPARAIRRSNRPSWVRKFGDRPTRPSTSSSASRGHGFRSRRRARRAGTIPGARREPSATKVRPSGRVPQPRRDVGAACSRADRTAVVGVAGPRAGERHRRHARCRAAGAASPARGSRPRPLRARRRARASTRRASDASLRHRLPPAPDPVGGLEVRRSRAPGCQRVPLVAPPAGGRHRGRVEIEDLRTARRPAATAHVVTFCRRRSARIERSTAAFAWSIGSERPGGRGDIPSRRRRVLIRLTSSARRLKCV